MVAKRDGNKSDHLKSIGFYLCVCVWGGDVNVLELEVLGEHYCKCTICH